MSIPSAASNLGVTDSINVKNAQFRAVVNIKQIDMNNAQDTEAKIYQSHYLTAFQRKLLQKSLEQDLHESYRQRIQIMLLADQGKSQTEICQTLGCCAATVRHWMHIARSGMAHQWQDCPIGRPKAVNDEYLDRLKELINQSPRDYGYSFQRWTVNWLNKHLAKELGIEVSNPHLQRLLKEMGLSTIPTRRKVNSPNGRENDGHSILISDLKSANNSESNSFWLFNPSNMA
ncbi:MULTISPECIES: helix-turn-helix domain-containing protein [unclassified Moorena]|uniref:helix-turn-helix domain-containing protein n=1 Tax=unclassified Moorena TaxID=2683338 RepID=UPI0025F14FB6|nr:MULTISPECIES: helix-turn-helix domain-containing protein [unclassified Moorena]